MSPLPKINSSEILQLSKEDVYQILKWHLETFYGKEITNASHYSGGAVYLTSNIKKVAEDKVIPVEQAHES